MVGRQATPSQPADQVAGLAQTQRIDAAALRQAVAAVPEHSRLVFTSGPLAGVAVALDKPMILVGRALDNDVVLEEPRVSRYHAEIHLRGGRFHLRDMKSTNGSTVNGQEVSERALQDGDCVSFAGVEMLFHSGQ
jgi:hypothetical protein